MYIIDPRDRMIGRGLAAARSVVARPRRSAAHSIVAELYQVAGFAFDDDVCGSGQLWVWPSVPPTVVSRRSVRCVQPACQPALCVDPYL